MTEPRIIAEVHDYPQLVVAMRMRVAELGCAYETIDYVAGLPLRYTSKLLAAAQMKALGRISLGPLLGVLGIKLHVVEDPEALARVSHRLVPRRDGNRNAGDRMLAVKGHKRRPYNVLRNNPARARFLRAVQVLGQSSAERSRIARNAANERWRRVREAAA